MTIPRLGRWCSRGLLVLLALLCMPSAAGAGVRPPQAVAGVLDLRDWNFEDQGLVPLEGEWTFTWIASPRP